MTSASFTVVDWVIFGILILFSGVVGIYYACCGGKQKTTDEFLMADRNMSVLPVAASILVSFQTAILILGQPAEMYTKGTQFFLSLIGQLGAVFLATTLFVPLFYPLKLTSFFEYLEHRFDCKAARVTATSIGIISTVLYSGIASFAPSTALSAVTGFPEWLSFTLIGVICAFYTFLGGLKAVIWVDAFQGIIMLAGILTILIKATLLVGDWGTVWRINDDWGRINFWNFDPDPTIRHSFWSLVIGTMINWTGPYGASQQSTQRFGSLPTLRKAKIALMLQSVGLIVIVTTSCMAGVAVFAYYVMKGCDPLTNGDIQSSNQIIPTFVMEVLNYPGVPGLFMASLYSGSLSTISSNLSTLVATSFEDLIKPFVRKKSDRVHLWITRILVLFFSAAGIGMSFLVRNLTGTVLQASISILGSSGGALNGFVVLGAFFPSCNRIGAITGPIVSYAIMLWIGIGQYSVIGVPEDFRFPTENCQTGNLSSMVSNFTMSTVDSGLMSTTPVPMVPEDNLTGLNRLYSLSYLWYSTLGTIIAVVIALIITYITGPRDAEEVDKKYLLCLSEKLSWLVPSCCGRNSYSTDQKIKGRTGQDNIVFSNLEERKTGGIMEKGSSHTMELHKMDT
ncbi:sodium-coupled monocarboxylate transporter 1-like [Ostrea edulis]|uniref:sodium-coupled monocarboxylate transporter 1-like n=1 Tax=Ostrea edulis TaxID=37623 RepID=UPI0024AF3FDD|nr:sodium-coupled monocarboxylate transporter 1-like [Ostrea edulis]